MIIWPETQKIKNGGASNGGAKQAKHRQLIIRVVKASAVSAAVIPRRAIRQQEERRAQAGKGVPSGQIRFPVVSDHYPSRLQVPIAP